MNPIIEEMARAHYEANPINVPCSGGETPVPWNELGAGTRSVLASQMCAAIRAAMECEPTWPMRDAFRRAENNYNHGGDWRVSPEDAWRALLGALVEDAE